MKKTNYKIIILSIIITPILLMIGVFVGIKLANTFGEMFKSNENIKDRYLLTSDVNFKTEYFSQELITYYNKLPALNIKTEHYFQNICQNNSCNQYKIKPFISKSSNMYDCFKNVTKLEVIPFYKSSDLKNIYRYIYKVSFSDGTFPLILSEDDRYNFYFWDWIPNKGFKIENQDDNFYVFSDNKIELISFDKFYEVTNKMIDNACYKKNKIDSIYQDRNIWNESKITKS